MAMTLTTAPKTSTFQFRINPEVRERAEEEIFGSFLEWYKRTRTEGKEKDKRSPASQRAGTASLLYYKD